MPLIEFTDKGLYCPAGGFYIDPWKPVNRAVITHAHADHARAGSQSYLCHRFTAPLLQLRLGTRDVQAVEWDETVYLSGVKISLHPAGHIIGSAQVRVEYGGEVWVVSGDYKTEYDGLSTAFEPVRCHTFVTESTFGLPIYRWKDQEQVFEHMRNWVLQNREAGRNSIFIAYSLGKAQRLAMALQPLAGRLLAHGAVFNMHEWLRRQGWALPPMEWVNTQETRGKLVGQTIIAPPSALGTTWLKRFSPYAIGVCSGWMQVRGHVRRKNVDAGFVLSDHADWKGLLQAVDATGASKVYVTHGFQSVFARYLQEKGLEAAEVKTEYGDEKELELEAGAMLPDAEADKTET